MTGAGLTGQLPIVLASVTAMIVLVALPLCRAWDLRILGQGAEEFRRLGRVVLAAIVGLALFGIAARVEDVRPWAFVAVPLFGVVALPLRYGLRRMLHARRRIGSCMLPVLAAGTMEAVSDLIERTQRTPYWGWRVEAVCTPEGMGPDGATEIAGVPVIGDLDDLAPHVRCNGYRVVAVASAPQWTPRRLQQLAWDLEDSTAEMVVAPALMEVAGPRLNVAPVFGLTLLRVSAPTFTGLSRLAKAVVDRLGALLLLALFAPVLLTIALVVRLSDGGPVFYRQQRVGRNGRQFTMLKFRTMVVDADARRGDLLVGNEAAGPLFKIRNDPRVTRVGAWLRRYSLDELPQLINVLAGPMSLVGPRPPLPEEVTRFGRDAMRRLLVKPGMTGLWQVSGRSELSWEETVRLDLRYVENWSLMLDVLILWKTAWAVVGARGAY